MLKLIAIHLLLTATLLVVKISAKPSQTVELKFQTQNPYVVPIGSNLFVVSKNQTHIRIDSSDRSYTPCEIVVNEIEHEIPGRIKATALGTQKIIIYGVHNSSERLMIKSVFHTILLIDPRSCELKTLTGLIQDKVPLFFPVTSAEIVVHDNHQFDVFYLGPKECSPCRFDFEGRRVELIHQLKADRMTPSDFHLRELKQNNEYAYAFNFQNGTSVLKVLDRDFKVLNSLYLNNTLFDFSTSSGAEKSFIGATYNTPESPYEFFYALFDPTLQPIFTHRLDELDSNHIGINAQFNIDSKGNSFVSFQQLSVEEGDSKVSLIRYDAHGNKVGDSLGFTEIPNDAIYETQTLLLDDREYCLVLHKMDEPYGETKIECSKIII